MAVAVLILVGFYFGYQSYYLPRLVEPASEYITEKPAEISKPEENIPVNEVKPTAPTPISEYKIYKNMEFGFEIQYPYSWTVTEEINENIRGEMVKEFFFKKPNSDLRFAILPRDGLSYGLGAKGTTTQAFIGGYNGMQTQYILKDGRRLWLIFPRYGLNNWLEDLGRIDVMTSIEDASGDTIIFEKMLNSLKLKR